MRVRRLSYISPWTHVITKILNVDQIGRRVRFRERFEEADVEQGHEPKNSGGLCKLARKQVIP